MNYLNNIAYLRHRMGSTVAVLDADANFVQTTGYYPSGTPYQLLEERLATKVDAATDRLHIGNAYLSHSSLNMYDNTARLHDPLLMRFGTPDPLYVKSPGASPWAHCSANPLNFVDPLGCDTVQVGNRNGVWEIMKTKVAPGKDIITVENNLSAIFSDGEYGERVIALNLESNDSYTIGVIHVSGTDATFLYVTPGGESSNVVDSKKRINDGVYMITTPKGWEEWRKPGVGGEAEARGCRFHYGKGNLLKWTEGCYVLMSKYRIDNGKIMDCGDISSMQCSDIFDESLGATSHFYYKFRDRNNPEKIKTRRGSKFNNDITSRLYQRSLK